MADGYRIFGAEMSPYSVKVRSYFRYKAIPHQWVLRNAASQAEYEKYAKMPIIPLVVTPDGTGIQDSTPIIDRLEKLFSVPSIHPDDGVANFISTLIEEFGDEWGNKWMFHYRWARDVDQISSAGRIARMRGPDASEDKHAGFASQVRARMVDRVWFVGSNAETAPQIEAGFIDMLGLSLRGPICSAGVRRLATSVCGARFTKCGPTRPRAPSSAAARRMCSTGCSACCGRRPKVLLRPGRRCSRP
jgi:glutathione S-transferase